jgi:hypothetical protein
MRTFKTWVIGFSFCALACDFSTAALAQSEQPSTPPRVETSVADAATSEPAGPELSTSDSNERHAGQVSGRIVDPVGVPVAGARIKLAADGGGPPQEASSGDDGQFSFANVAPGDFHLVISSSGFGTQEFSGNLNSRQSYTVPPIALAIAEVITEVRVVPSTVEVAQEQIKAQEKQRALGFVPNFYVSYVPDAAPLTSRQKFGLAWKTIIDPVNFALIGAVAGVEQQQNDFSGYGQGAQGYAKRYGAAYASDAADTLVGSAILPALLKQDPRYFYKGTGSIKSRVLYAIANSVICKGDNGRWQPNYSAVLGGFAAGGISNLYYPAKDRNGVGLTLENAVLGTVGTAATNLLQEFLIRRLTPNLPNHDPGNSSKLSGPIAKMFSALVHSGD